MFEKEEKMLGEMKNNLDSIPIPISQLDQAILFGFQNAKHQERNPKKRIWILSSLAAAILLIAFLSVIRVSPAFAYYISSIPVMEKIVKFIRHDKGLMSAVENDYAQEINVTKEKNGLKVTIDSAIADENGLVVFYTIESKNKQKTFDMEEVELKSGDGVNFTTNTFSYSNHNSFDEPKKKVSNSLEFFFQEPLKTKKFVMNMMVSTDEQIESFKIPFSIEKPIKTKKSFDLNETVLVEGQKITIKNVTIYPLRVAVHVVMDPTNRKKLFAFEDLRLVDENGESWTKISNGTTASFLNDHEQILYLQSNYFREAKELYLAFSKIQAVDKDEAYVLVDTNKQQILKQPKGNILSLSDEKMEHNDLVFALNVKEDFHYHIFNSIRDVNGKDIFVGTSYSSYTEDHKQLMGVTLPDHYTNPLRLEMSFYPTWIEGDVKIRIQ